MEAPARPPPRGGDLVIALGVAAAALVVQLPFRLHGANLIDEGAIMQIADDLLRGRRLYVDAVHPAFPGVHYLTAGAFALFGSSVATTRTLGAVLFALTTAVVFLIARWWHSRPVALGVVVLFLCYRVWAYPHWHMVSYSSLALTLVLLATWIVGEALAGTARWPYLLAGAMAAAAMLVKQDSGVAGGAALAAAIVVCRPDAPGTRSRALLAYVGGGALVLGAATAAVLASGIAVELVRQAIVAPLYGYGNFAYQGLPALWPLLQQDAEVRRQAFSYFPSILLDTYWPAITQSALYRKTALPDAALKIVYHLPWMVLLPAAASIVVRRLRGSRTLAGERETLVVVLAAALLLAFNRPRDWIHLLVLYPPTLLLGTLLIARVVRGLGRGRRAAVGLAVLGLVVATVASAAVAVRFRRLHDVPVRSARGLLYATAAQASALQAVVDWAAAAPPDVPLASFPYHPLVNYLTGRPGLTRFYAVWPVDPDPHREDEIVRDLEQAPRALVTYSTTQVPHFPGFPDYAHTLFPYLAANFTIDRVAGGEPGGFTFLLLRREPPPAGPSLLGAGLDQARVRVEDEGAPPREVSGEERGKLVGATLWPFLPVVRTATLPGAAVAVSYRVTPEPGDQLEVGFGLNPAHWLDFPPTPVRFSVAVERDGAAHEVLAVEVDPRRPADRRWQRHTVDLAPWAGAPIDVVLRTRGPRGGTTSDLAGWSELRLVPSHGGVPLAE